jgi:hypothetical protein
MAHFIPINPPRTEAENEAQRLLARILPTSWIVTTNVYEHNFPTRRKTEIDSIVICPFGLFILDFKNFKSRQARIIPMANRVWDGLEGNAPNPIAEAQNKIFALKDLFRAHNQELDDELWVEWLVVLTHRESELDWSSSDLNSDSILHVCSIGQVEGNIRQIGLARRVLLDRKLARQALRALKPAQLPSRLFDVWNDTSPRHAVGLPSATNLGAPASTTIPIKRPTRSQVARVLCLDSQIATVNALRKLAIQSCLGS